MSSKIFKFNNITKHYVIKAVVAKLKKMMRTQIGIERDKYLMLMGKMDGLESS